MVTLIARNLAWRYRVGTPGAEVRCTPERAGSFNWETGNCQMTGSIWAPKLLYEFPFTEQGRKIPVGRTANLLPLGRRHWMFLPDHDEALAEGDPKWVKFVRAGEFLHLPSVCASGGDQLEPYRSGIRVFPGKEPDFSSEKPVRYGSGRTAETPKSGPTSLS